MAPKRRSSEQEDAVIRQGCLIKSPPPNAFFFTNRTSWKGRLVKVCKTPIGSHYIRYYSYNGETEDFKGEIPISDIQAIELGTNIKDPKERIQTIVQLFNNSPEHVLCIKTKKRDYYLVDDNEKNIADWKTFLTDIWVEINKKDNDDAVRPKSYPQDYPRTESATLEAQERQRSLTDPEKWRGALTAANQKQSSFEKISETLEPLDEVFKRKGSITASPSLPTKSPLTKEISRLTLDAINKMYKESSRYSEDSTEVDAAYNSDPELENIYDIPTSIPVQGKPNLSPDYTEEEESSDFESPDEDVYQKMHPISLDSETENASDLSPSCLPMREKTVQCPPKPIRTSKLFTEPIRYPKTQGSQLKKTYMLKLMYEQNDCSDLEKMILTVPTTHLQEYLGLQEVGERLCVSKWKGPAKIGCIFHHGDHIEAINGVRPGSKDFFLQMLNNSITDEVTLVVVRNKKAGVFHAEGCQCEGS